MFTRPVDAASHAWRLVKWPGEREPGRQRRASQQAGFTLAEIRTLFYGFPERTPASARWETMAQRKLVEVEELIARARGMKELLKKALRCGCLTLEDCALVTRRLARRTPSA